MNSRQIPPRRIGLVDVPVPRIEAIVERDVIEERRKRLFIRGRVEAIRHTPLCAKFAFGNDVVCEDGPNMMWPQAFWNLVENMPQQFTRYRPPLAPRPRSVK